MRWVQMLESRRMLSASSIDSKGDLTISDARDVTVIVNGPFGSAVATIRDRATGVSSEFSGVGLVDIYGSDCGDLIRVKGTTGASVVIFGGGGDDRIDIDATSDFIPAGGIEALGEAGNDTICGGPGNDGIDGGDGNDDLSGGGGNDIIYGGAGDDRVNGNDGDDHLNGDTGNDTVRGGEGNDTIELDAAVGGIYGDGATYFTGGRLTVNGGAGEDVLQLTGNTAINSMLFDLAKVKGIEVTTFVDKAP